MKRLFGTDGIRGKSNSYPMNAEIILKLGQAAAITFRKHNKTEKIRAVIGKDTRKSGYIFEYALTAGLCSMGVDVYLVGPMPTPAIAHITKSFAADFGIVISASHNPASDNGIKFFDNDGFKLPTETEKEMENLVLNACIDTTRINGTRVGKAHRIDDAAGRYIEYTKTSINNISLENLKIVLDCANGAAYKVSPMIFRELGAEVIILNNRPDGLNINDNCGSTYPDVIRSTVLGYGADAGIALDGDADRVIMIDEKGQEIDGDRILAMCAIDLKKSGRLKNNRIVATIMSNMGLDAAMKKEGITVTRTRVGDHNVVSQLRKDKLTLGGEQSGHIIFFNNSTTGDGTLCALQVLALMKKTGKKLSQLADCMETYPQVLNNVVVHEKVPFEQLPEVQSAIERANNILGDTGRILVRYSGTEKKCRVMAEGKNDVLISKIVDDVSSIIEKTIGRDHIPNLNTCSRKDTSTRTQEIEPSKGDVE